jgi:RNA polymerase sigma-70 factor (ECF subfamily)
MDPERKKAKEERYYPLTDERLRLLIDRGDKLAYNELYARYWFKAISVAKSFLKDEGNAHDLVQTLFGDLWRDPSDFKTDKNGSFSAFFLEAVRNRCRSYLRREKRLDLVADLDEEPLAEIEDRSLSEDEVVALIRTTCNPQESEVVVLRIFSGESFARIAYVLGLSEDAASSVYSRALSKLRANPKIVALATESVALNVTSKGKEPK